MKGIEQMLNELRIGIFKFNLFIVSFFSSFFIFYFNNTIIFQS